MFEERIKNGNKIWSKKKKELCNNSVWQKIVNQTKKKREASKKNVFLRVKANYTIFKKLDLIEIKLINGGIRNIQNLCRIIYFSHIVFFFFFFFFFFSRTTYEKTGYVKLFSNAESKTFWHTFEISFEKSRWHLEIWLLKWKYAEWSIFL